MSVGGASAGGIVALAAAVGFARPALALPLLVASLPLRLPVVAGLEVPTLVLLGAAAGRAPAIARAVAARPLALAALLALPAWVLVSSLWARAPWFAVRECGKWLAIVLAAALAMAHERRDPRPLVAAFLLSLLPSAGWAIAERLHWVRPLGDPQELALRVITLGDLVRGRGLYYHPNRLAEFVEQVGMLLLACAVLGPWRIACAAGALLATAGVWASGSAASIAVMAGGGLVAVAALLAWEGGHLRRWRRDPAARRGFALGIGSLGLAAAVAAMVARRAWIAHGGLGSRGRVYALAARVIRAHPWLGVGAGNWPFEANDNPLDRFWFTSHTHSIVLQLWAELGVVGLLAGATTLLGPPTLGLAGAGRGPRAWRGVAVGAALGVFALAAHDVVHWFLRVAADGLPTGVLLGLAAAAAPAGAAARDGQGHSMPREAAASPDATSRAADPT